MVGLFLLVGIVLGWCIGYSYGYKRRGYWMEHRFRRQREYAFRLGVDIDAVLDDYAARCQQVIEKKIENARVKNELEPELE